MEFHTYYADPYLTQTNPNLKWRSNLVTFSNLLIKVESVAGTRVLGKNTEIVCRTTNWWKAAVLTVALALC